MMSGILVALIFPMVIMPMLGVDKGKWILTMSILSIISLPLILLEYYYTKERVTEESADMEEKKIPFLTQLRIVLTDKYMVIIFVYFLIYTFGVSMKNLGLVYYCNWVLGTYNDGITQMLISVIGGVPMGIGIFAVWPLAKKFGKRNVTMWGFVLYAIGSLICWLFPTNLVIVLIGQFIKNVGGLPCAYVFMALFADTLDHIEWKSGIRCDGIAMSIYNVIACALIGVVTGIFNGLLANAGYVAPQLDELGNIIATTQPDQVKEVITFAFVGLETITGVILAILLIFLSVEKTVGRKQSIIKARQGAEVAEEDTTPLTEKESAAWEKEMARGEKFYKKIQKKISGK
jgi:GPH family glycoside/pentoside/hexuronide:cation symporter